MGKSTKSYADRRPPEEFWQMTIAEFNDWRRKEDFPRIVDFFRNNLNGFNDWQHEYGIDPDYLIQEGLSDFLVLEDFFDTQPRGKFKYYVEVSTSNGENHSFVSTRAPAVSDTRTIKRSLEFEPFVAWAVRRKRNVHPSAHNTRLQVTTIEAFESPEYCRTFFLGDLELLKLGGAKLSRSPNLAERMLQFLNLDFLNFEDVRFDSSYRKRISFSSARHWKIANSELHFYDFLDSSLDRLTVHSSLLDDWRFIRCDGGTVKITDSRMTRCLIGQGTFIPYFDNVDLSDTELIDHYETIHDLGFRPNPELPRRMKAAFISRGQHHKAGRCYFIERKLEKQESFNRAAHHLRTYVFPNDFPGRISEAWKQKNESGMSWVALLRRSVSLIFERAPRRRHYSFALEAAKEGWFFLSSLIQEVWWGYGEKPIQVVAISFLIVLGFSGMIHSTHTILHSGSFLDSFYYSVVSFLTVGDSQFTPIGITRTIVAIEALLGILNLGLLIGGFANKAKY